MQNFLFLLFFCRDQHVFQNAAFEPPPGRDPERAAKHFSPFRILALSPAKFSVLVEYFSVSLLTNQGLPDIIDYAGLIQGEMAEWFKALVLKTSDVARHRGFESLSLRQFNTAMEKYPRGRRGSPAKGVGCDKCREGSNPSFSATQPTEFMRFCRLSLYNKTDPPALRKDRSDVLGAHSPR